jgi:hypothetical protein
MLYVKRTYHDIALPIHVETMFWTCGTIQEYIWKNISLGKVHFNHAFYTLCGIGRFLNKVWTNYKNQNLTFWVNRVPIKKTLVLHKSYDVHTMVFFNIPYFQNHCKTITHPLGTWSKCKPQIHISWVKVKHMVNLKKRCIFTNLEVKWDMYFTLLFTSANTPSKT